MSHPVSPLAPKGGFPDLPDIAGVRFATVAAGVKYQGRTDVMLAHCPPGTSIAGVFTQSATRSAAVLDCEAKRGGPTDGAAAILVNSGNSNAFTGAGGVASVERLVASVAAATDVPPARIFTASTGVIGEPLPDDKITARLTELTAGLGAASMADAAAAIMTTDTFPKGAGRTVEIGGKVVAISGIAKGSGMIAPDMATMLVYIFTDAAIDQGLLQTMVSEANARTFNCITVDSDTSTSDTLIVAATGASGGKRLSDPQDPETQRFAAALQDVMLELAHLVVRDGEGATKFVTISVTGATDTADARRAALAIANSPLVKTAIAGEDANWGRVVMAIGKSGARADRDRIAISFGDVQVAEAGWRSPGYSEAAASAHMKEEEISISVDLGLGDGTATVWTCDLTHGYISINADYRS